jgi:hypothetical protein
MVTDSPCHNNPLPLVMMICQPMTLGLSPCLMLSSRLEGRRKRFLIGHIWHSLFIMYFLHLKN